MPSCQLIHHVKREERCLTRRDLTKRFVITSWIRLREIAPTANHHVRHLERLAYLSNRRSLHFDKVATQLRSDIADLRSRHPKYITRTNVPGANLRRVHTAVGRHARRHI